MSISVAKIEVDSRLTHPPNWSLPDIAQFWGEFFNIVLPINWYIRIALAMSERTASE